jgi:hypothetical protein
MKTDSTSIFLFVPPNSLSTGFVDASTQYWTGLSSDWTLNFNLFHCANWNSDLNTNFGTVGEGGKTNSGSIATTAIGCDIKKQLLCIQQ